MEREGPFGLEHVTRTIGWNVTGWMMWLLYIGAAVAVLMSVWRLWRRARVWRSGLPIEQRPTWTEAAGNLTRWLAGRGKMRRDPYAGTMHALILWGFVILFIGTTLVALEYDTPLHFFYGNFYLVASAIIDAGGLAFLVGLGMAVYRRYVNRKQRLKDSVAVDGMLALLISLGISGFLVEGARIAVHMPDFEVVSFVGYGLALAFRATGAGVEALEGFHRLSWLGHAVLSIGFFAFGTAYFFRHVVVSAMTVAFAPSRASTGALRPYPLLAGSTVGTARPIDFRWTDLMDGDACTTCGRCSSVCPANVAGKALDPRGIVLGLEALVSQAAGANGHGAPSGLGNVTRDAIWDCTTCGACNHACPVNISVFDKIIDFRRQLVDLGEVPASGQAALEGTSTRDNPWAYAPAQRNAWRESLKLPVVNAEKPPEWIYWIGCAGAYEPTAQAISKATAALFKEAGVDFAILGSESCTGDPARRLGEEGLFQSCKQKNIETLRKAGAKKIVTHCPHCLNTFMNEYSNGGPPEFTVVHHTQLFETLLAEGKLKVKDTGAKAKVTFHDPCYLGRHNGEYDAPRTLVDAVPGLQRVEMPRTKQNSLCCGGGGGQMWLANRGGERVEGLRLAEAKETGAEVVATGCPFCKVMLESAAATAGTATPIQVRDVSEILLESVERK